MSPILKIAVVSRIESPTLMNKIRPVALQRGHTMDVLSSPIIDISQLTSSDLVQSMSGYDVVYYRTGLGVAGARIVGEYLRTKSVPSVNFFHGAYPYFFRKLYQLALVSAAGIRIPKTVLNYNHKYDDLVEALGAPFVAKPDIGTHGDGIHIISSESDLVSIAKTLGEKDYFFQEYIPHEFDYRVPVIDGKATCPYRRVPVEGEFRANVTLGGETKPIEPERVAGVAKLAEQIVPVCGSEIVGVDLLPHKETGELYFAEVNDNPGWKNVAQVLGSDPSDAVVDLLEKRASK